MDVKSTRFPHLHGQDTFKKGIFPRSSEETLHKMKE